MCIFNKCIYQLSHLIDPILCFSSKFLNLTSKLTLNTPCKSNKNEKWNQMHFLLLYLEYISVCVLFSYHERITRKFWKTKITLSHETSVTKSANKTNTTVELCSTFLKIAALLFIYLKTPANQQMLILLISRKKWKMKLQYLKKYYIFDFTTDKNNVSSKISVNLFISETMVNLSSYWLARYIFVTCY